MQHKNQRILKKLSQRSAEFLQNVEWSRDDCEPSCEVYGSVKEHTPVMWVRANSESVCAWVVLKKVFILEKEDAYLKGYEWFYGAKPTPENVFWWAFWNCVTLEKITNDTFSGGF